MADRIVTAISRWLAHHSSDDDLRRELEAIDLVDLTPAQAEAVLELQNELDVNADRPAVEMIAREALEAIAVADRLPGSVKRITRARIPTPGGG